MVTGQSFVLYSRLHLVVRKRRTLRLVLSMIIIDAVVLHTPTIVLTIGSNGPSGAHFAPIFNVMERIQLAIFCIQEFIISTIYIFCTVRLLKSIYHTKTRSVMMELIIINFVCLSMDVVLVALEYSNNYVGETSAKAMLYAIKLKLEFAVLNQLMSLTSRGLTEENYNTRPSFTARGNSDPGASHAPNAAAAYPRNASTTTTTTPAAGIWRSGRGGDGMRNRTLIHDIDPRAADTPKLASWKSRRVWNGSFSRNDGRGRTWGELHHDEREAGKKGVGGFWGKGGGRLCRYRWGG
ncbi:uncharacterized protein KY384_006280 [Bacidia gigantensis]|uniref:uncharacterized protein n=1 Tax=Bacidia gigantensis TaxID=2732470 RepID=UPI001D05029E|nr:uncharacterized protein KY384_006280 [Bacidia gigantensis]KAG8528593.1 hypothetical protein KY384_006280 [Bacidia gigantensis]